MSWRKEIFFLSFTATGKLFCIRSSYFLVAQLSEGGKQGEKEIVLDAVNRVTFIFLTKCIQYLVNI